MMAQSTMAQGLSQQSKNGDDASIQLLLASSLASLDRYFAGMGAPAINPARVPVVAGSPELERSLAAAKKVQSEFLAPPEIGPYR